MIKNTFRNEYIFPYVLTAVLGEMTVLVQLCLSLLTRQICGKKHQKNEGFDFERYYSRQYYATTY